MDNLQEQRKIFERLGAIYPKEASVKVQQELIGGVSCYWFSPEEEVDGEIMIWLHGGVYSRGSIRSHEAMVSHFAAKLRTRFLFIEYALAPEQPFPAPVRDLLTVYAELLSRYPGYAYGFVGDSAGGGLIVSAISEMLRPTGIGDRRLPLPRAVALISPWISLACDKPSYAANATKDRVLKQQYLLDSAKDYIGDAGLERADPENAPLASFPPTVIVVGSTEILLDDSRDLYRRLRGIQERVVMTVYEGEGHVWLLSNIASEASQHALAEIKGFWERVREGKRAQTFHGV